MKLHLAPRDRLPATVARSALVALLLASVPLRLVLGRAFGQTPPAGPAAPASAPPPATPPAASPSSSGRPPAPQPALLTAEQLDKLVAPIAL